MPTLHIGDSIYTKYYGLIGVDSCWFSIVEMFVFPLYYDVFLNFSLMQTLDFLLQILVVFPKIEPLRCKVCIRVPFFNVILKTLWLIKPPLLGHFIYSQYGEHFRSICISISSEGIGAVATRKSGVYICLPIYIMWFAVLMAWKLFLLFWSRLPQSFYYACKKKKKSYYS